MPILTTATLLDVLLSKGLDVGLDKLAKARPEQLNQAVHKLREQEDAVRQARLKDILAQAADTARAEFKGQVDPMGASLTQMLDHPPFLVRAAELLLLGEWPDTNRLREEFQPLVSTDQWLAGQRVLLLFLRKLDDLLLKDETWGPILRDFRLEARLANIDRNTLALAQISEQMAGLPDGIAQAVIQRLYPVDPAELEKHYLRGVYAECSDVPLASGSAPPRPGIASPGVSRTAFRSTASALARSAALIPNRP